MGIACQCLEALVFLSSPWADINAKPPSVRMAARSSCAWLSLLLLPLSAAGVPPIADISCRNEAGEPVDWFILYKLPKHKIKENDRTGLEYMYLDSQTPAWQMSMRLVNMTQSVLGITLKQIYQTYKTKDNSTAYLMYNDGRPNSRNYSTKLGHTKGCLLFDKSQGFWLIHSIPRFPPFPEKGYGYPSSGKRNGQTAICVTYKNNQFPEIEEESLQHAQWHHQKIMARKELWTNKTRQLLIYNPDVYNCSIPEVFHQELSNLQKICLGAHQSWTPRKRLAKLQSAQGEPFLHFAKSHYYIDGDTGLWPIVCLYGGFMEDWDSVFDECHLPLWFAPFVPNSQMTLDNTADLCRK